MSDIFVPDDLKVELHRLTVVCYLDEDGEELTVFHWENESMPRLGQAVGMIEIIKSQMIDSINHPDDSD